ncbi:polyketide cyclase [Leptospira yasudae]|uniref:SRPBCC family protein n=1 Tax=Leptospira yasudae TaxID=2202201 RepID=UPI00108413DE|nr:SRPBCC family protein [Leptospira yasudae]TGK23191.1 polyketide cyclase [Leptospira yasudae]TGM00445.1 polyketide cyclase [Leptospira yasudae]
MSKLKTILLAIAGILILFILGTLALASTKPADFHYERSANIKASPEKVFALVNDYRTWTGWSPWEKLDPAMKRTYSGATSGKGAIYEWAGNDSIGKGRMEIIEADSPSKIKIQLDFFEPFEAHNTAEFTFTEEQGSTKVTWAMYGKNQFVSKVFGLFCDMDQMIGKDFEAGLNGMKSIAEGK